MPTLLFRLNDVPEDEADDVRRLLNEHRFAFYETEAGRWGFSVAGIWLHDGEDVESARRLLADYQQRRATRVRAEYEALQATGEAETQLRRLLRRPLQILVYLAIIALVLYLTVMPFINFLE